MRLGPAKRVRRIVFVAMIVALVPVAVSYATAMAGPSNSSVFVRSVEWLRGQGAAGTVAQIESLYYRLTAPDKGGPNLKSLPKVGVKTGAASGGNRPNVIGGPTATAAYRPPPVTPFINPPLAGEGQWQATRPWLAGNPPVLVTTIRNEPDYPRVVAGLAWIDAKSTKVTLNPGRQEPSVQIDRGAMEVPLALRKNLLATFNSGFKLADSTGGFALNGHTYSPMVKGQATLIGYQDGTVNVIGWDRGPLAPTSATFARQNLPLIVDKGVVSGSLTNGREWGATVGGAIMVWRSGIGVDAHGNLIYAAGDNQTVSSLASVLVRAGAVRAMELDINSYWVSFITYGLTGARQPTNLLPGMDRSSSRYLTPEDRDFFAVYAR